MTDRWIDLKCCLPLPCLIMPIACHITPQTYARGRALFIDYVIVCGFNVLSSYFFHFLFFLSLTTALHYPLYSCCCPLFVLDSVCTVTVSFQSIIGHFRVTCVSQNRTARTAHALVSKLLVIPCNLISITATLSAHNAILPYCSLPLPLVELKYQHFRLISVVLSAATEISAVDRSLNSNCCTIY